MTLDARDPSSPPRGARQPEQKRSRERRRRILDAASDLIARGGSDRLKMSEVAQTAGISIGSLYQYFADKPAIIHALADQTNAESRRCIEIALTPVVSRAQLLDAFSALMNTFYEMVRSEPVTRDIWAGMQADRELARSQLEESRAMSVVLAQAIARVGGGTVTPSLQSRCLLLWELGEATVRLAISCPPDDGADMVRSYVRMALHELDLTLLDGDPA